MSGPYEKDTFPTLCVISSLPLPGSRLGPSPGPRWIPQLLPITVIGRDSSAPNSSRAYVEKHTAWRWGGPARHEYPSISSPIWGPWSHVSTRIALLATSPGHIGDRKEVAEQKRSRCSSSAGHRGSLLPQHLARSARRWEAPPHPGDPTERRSAQGQFRNRSSRGLRRVNFGNNLLYQ